MKRVLKAALEDSVPREILTRKKTGFPVPYERWLRGELKDFVSDTVLDGYSAVDGCFRRKQIQELLNVNSQSGRLPKEVFCLVVLRLWEKCFRCPTAGNDNALPAMNFPRSESAVSHAQE